MWVWNKIICSWEVFIWKITQINLWLSWNLDWACTSVLRWTKCDWFQWFGNLIAGRIYDCKKELSTSLMISVTSTCLFVLILVITVHSPLHDWQRILEEFVECLSFVSERHIQWISHSEGVEHVALFEGGQLNTLCGKLMRRCNNQDLTLRRKSWSSLAKCPHFFFISIPAGLFRRQKKLNLSIKGPFNICYIFQVWKLWPS